MNFIMKEKHVNMTIFLNVNVIYLAKPIFLIRIHG